MLELDVRLPAGRPRRIPVRVGTGALRVLIADVAARAPGGRVVVLSDSNVARLHGEPLCGALRGAGLATDLLDFPAGEASKTRETKSALEDRLLAIGADRATTLVALGGGVTGDLAGFLAATWHRGIALVQAPTSLLAMVDAALGGKTGVDLPGGKNLVGAFHQPLGVYADVALLATLPLEEFPAGLAEVVKSAVVADAAFFRSLEAAASELVDRGGDALEAAIAGAMRIKARIVSRDEREAGRRAALNFGHTVGHAIEAASDYRVSHGRAVATGMVVEGRMAVALTGFPERQLRRLVALLASLGIDRSWPVGVERDRVRALMTRDKKTRAGAVRCALPARIGRMPAGAETTVAVDEDLLRSVLWNAASD